MRLLDGNVLPAFPQGKNANSNRAWLLKIRQAFDNSRARHLGSGSLSSRVLHNGTLAVLLRGQRLPSYIPPDRFADALIDEFRQSARDAVPTLDGIRDAIDKLPRGRPREALTAMAASATDVAAFHAAAASWFSDMMDRVSGWYTRQVSWILLGIGLVLAVLSNADTFYIVGRIAADPKLRTDFSTTVARSVGTKDDTVTLTNGLAGPLDELPIGWSQANVRRPTNDTPPQQALSIEGILWAIPGWLIMGIAVSLGAPFWFDLLQRLMQLRGSGPPPPNTTSASRQPVILDNKPESAGCDHSFG